MCTDIASVAATCSPGPGRVDLARSVFDDRVCPPGARARMRIYFLARAVRQVAWSLGHETLDWAAMLLAGGRGLNTVFALVFQENHLSLDVRIVLIVFVLIRGIRGH